MSCGAAAEVPGSRENAAKQLWLKRRRNSDPSHCNALSSHTDECSIGLDSSSASSDEEWPTEDATSQNVSAARGASPSVRRVRTNFPMEHDSAIRQLAKLTLDPRHSHPKANGSKKDGRLKLSVNETANSGFLARILGASLKHHLTSSRTVEHETRRTRSSSEATEDDHARSTVELAEIPHLNVVIMVIGSRGDIQPFIKVGKVLKEDYGHRVRIATHPAFKVFVEQDSGLEHFSVGGDPSELMAFMVKNPGLIPSFETLRKGEVGRRREQMAEMFQGFWHACVDDVDDGLNCNESAAKIPFVADAIIANPPSFAHVHCAERLGVPLHIMFTFPYTPTAKFPHPLANIKRTNVDESYTNFMSYPLVELMTWQGLGDLCNTFRTKTLGLDPVSTIWAPGHLYRMKVPYTYLWSPGLIPKPRDWGPEIDIAGFVFLDLASTFEPPNDLEHFLNMGEPPVYIGFGSIVVDDPAQFTELIFEGVKIAGVRAVVSKGWGGFGENADIPDNVFMLDNVPHDWLFQRTRSVVHHGGAGTTAIGLKLAKPTFIVPFFGDQPFWGSMVAASGAGQCVTYKELTAQKLAEGIKYCHSDEAQHKVQKIADCIARDGNGAANAVKSFHASLPLQGPKPMSCSILKNRAAVWRTEASNLRLSAQAAELLVQKGQLKYEKLHLWRQYAWTDFQGSGGPLTGGASAVVGSITGFGKGIGDGPISAAKDVQKRLRHEKRKWRHLKRQRERERAMEAADGPTKPTTIETEPLPLGAMEQQLVIPEGSDSRSTQRRQEPLDSRYDSSAQEQYDHLIPQRQETNSSGLSSDPESIATTVTRDLLHGMKDPAEAVARLPMDLFLGVTNGFHNMPRLYGDTVRRPVRVQDVRSGLRAGGTELAYGTYDAVTGVVTQPFQGAKKGGPLGLMAGVGKGLGGLVLKEGAALTAPISYTAQGIYKEATNHRTPIERIREARKAQGHAEVANLGDDMREQALQAASNGWSFMSELWDKAQKIKRGKIMPDGKPLAEHPSWPGGKYVARVRGRYEYEKERKELEKTGAFENVEALQNAVEARLA